MPLARIKGDHAEIACWHNTDHEIIIDKNLLFFVIDNPNYTNAIDTRYEVCIYHPSFEYECVYIANKDDIELVEMF